MEAEHADIIERIRQLPPGTVIPKPEARSDFKVKGIGMRRGEDALVYLIPNNKGGRLHEKGVTFTEFSKAFAELSRSGILTRAWANAHIPECVENDSCNFTTIGGVFSLLGHARYRRRGIYERT
ncbi:hypothetical protein [Martelella soudanensis]|uniref:hypothetical protein n=1 Tax=unclassified Martelella TaxID=2629616 RepID=UPI001AED70AE|nr:MULTISPECIES: hypothetical protein [unclassified Martelella]